MRATRVKGAVLCPRCSEVVDPEEHGEPEEAEVWQCPSCEEITTEGPADAASCSHEPPEVVMEQCGSCEVWSPTQEFRTMKQCPLCEEWVDPDSEDFDDDVDAYRCGECDTIYADRDEAKECCRS